MRLLIIQPWFTGVGHPAQSLINTASALGTDEPVDYLISQDHALGASVNPKEHLCAFGSVYCFDVGKPTASVNTALALWGIFKLRLAGHRYKRIFFFDATLPVLALLWPVTYLFLGVERISVLHLHGPELLSQSWLKRLTIKRFLMRGDVRLYLRTEELSLAWGEAYANISKTKIRHLPSLEIPDGYRDNGSSKSSEQIKFGLIGQIRVGKGIDWLVPVFRETPTIGKLLVAGAFFSETCKDKTYRTEWF